MEVASVLPPEWSALPTVHPAEGTVVTFTLCLLTGQMGAQSCQKSDWTSDKERAEIPQPHKPLVK